MTDKKKAVDWEAIERDYRAGIMSLREIADPNGVTEGAIRKRAKRDGWVRDLGAKIKARADDLVRKELVRSEVRTESASERETIEIGATVLARVKMSHRTDVARSRTLTMRLLEELEAQTAQVPELLQLGELMYKPDDKGIDKLNELYHKIIALPSRTKTMKDLGETLKTLIGLERQAFGMDTAPDEPPADTATQSPNEIGRRIAFLLTRAMKETQ